MNLINTGILKILHGVGHWIPGNWEARIEIFPGDGNGTNFVEIPVSTVTTGTKPIRFHAIAYDASGSVLDTDDVSWELEYGFNAKDPDAVGNDRLATLSSTDGNSTELTLFSTLRRGSIIGFQIKSKGTGYTNGKMSPYWKRDRICRNNCVITSGGLKN